MFVHLAGDEAWHPQVDGTREGCRYISHVET